jgi:hypothetical protein
MSSDPSAENAVEMIEPILDYLDGIIWVLNDVSVDAPVARYLETVKGKGKIIHRFWPGYRHHHAMNDTLFTGLIQEDDLVLWVDPLERCRRPFVSRVKDEVGPMMVEADVSVIFYFGKPYLFRYRESLEYRNTPHWSLQGWTGRAIDWSTIEPDESKVRLNVRPLKRKEGHHFALHYLRYYVCYPEGSNTCALGLEQHPGGATQETFARREQNRLAFRQELRKRGVSLTVEDVKALMLRPLDEVMLTFIRSDKVLSDAYHLFHGRGAELKDTHRPSDALPIP